MSRSIITLTTDFGEGSPYVAQMKGVILSRSANATIVDVTHAVAPQDVRQGARVLDEVTCRFPPGTVHVAVIDPGVGTSRRIVCARIAEQVYVAPDNGLLTLAAARGPLHEAVELTNRAYWLPEVSSTFHGRDIMAPVAASVGLGVELSELGPPAGELVKLDLPQASVEGNSIKGSIVSFDSFGNLITDVTAPMLASARSRSAITIRCGPHTIHGMVRAYGDAEPGTLVALFGSRGMLELAIVNGNAAKKLDVPLGEDVRVEW